MSTSDTAGTAREGMTMSEWVDAPTGPGRWWRCVGDGAPVLCRVSGDAAALSAERVDGREVFYITTQCAGVKWRRDVPVSADETTRLRALLKRAALPACEAVDNGVGEWSVTHAGPPPWTVAELWDSPAASTDAVEARARLFAAIPTALPGLLDAAERAERAEHKHATVLAALSEEAKDLHDRMTAAEVHATAAEREHREAGESTRAAWRESERREQELRDRLIAAERERDDLAATLETRTAEHALAVARIAALEARLTAARKATEDLPRHLGASWWGQQLRAALVEPTAEVSRARCPACNGRGVRLYGREIEDGCDECEATGYVPAEVSRG